MGEKVKKASSAAIEKTKKQWKFWTANSKKVTLTMLFLISVIVDEVWLDNALYTENGLFNSNLFKGIMVSIGIILTHDIKGLFNRWLDKKVIED